MDYDKQDKQLSYFKVTLESLKKQRTLMIIDSDNGIGSDLQQVKRELVIQRLDRDINRIEEKISNWQEHMWRCD